VAAYLGRQNGEPRYVFEDGLNPSAQPEVWPDAFFHGHAWPPEMATNPPPYAVELYARGLDNYIWAEGYIIRGPNAGTFIRSTIPYFPNREPGSTRKIFNGPYPG
jgi:hypothetical protein